MKILTKAFGLGDLAYWVFRPFVYFIDWVWLTDMRHCEVCKARRARWNDLFSLPRWAWLILVVTTLAACFLWWMRPMPVPFKSLAPLEARVVDLVYEANLPPCFDVTDATDVSDQSDLSDGGGGEEVII